MISAYIAASAREQSDGIALVNDAIVQLDQATQQNAALVEESAAAAQNLRNRPIGWRKLRPPSGG